MKDQAEKSAEAGRNNEGGEGARDVIRRDQDRAEKIAAMQRLIDEAEDSGGGSSSMGDILAVARRRLRAT